MKNWLKKVFLGSENPTKENIRGAMIGYGIVIAYWIACYFICKSCDNAYDKIIDSVSSEKELDSNN